MDLTYMNSQKQDIGVMLNYDLDLAFGSDENNFELRVSVNDHCCEAGYFIYIEGTEYGGIIDAIESDTATGEVIYTGRTWHGILNAKVLCPDSGQDYLTLSGDANAVMGTLISKMGLTSLFAASSDASALNIISYQMARYITGYDGIKKMLKSVGGKLRMAYDGEKVMVAAVPIVNYANEGFDSDLLAINVKKTAKKVNHLICLGQGELKDRTVVHLYADASGNISQTQTQTGLEEYSAVFDYPNAETNDDLIKAGKDRFDELRQQDNLAVDLDETEDIYDLGDIVGAVDNVSGIAIAVPISKKIVNVQNGYLSVSYETDIGNARVSTTSGANGKAGEDGHTPVITATKSGKTTTIKADGVAIAEINDGADATATIDSALSGASTNPVQNKVVKAALDGKLDKSGGTLTGNLTGQYLTGTWLQTTQASDLNSKPGKIAVLDSSGWVYYRTPAELLGDLGIQKGTANVSFSTATTATRTAVTFPKAYSSKPVVIVQQVFDSQNCVVKVEDVSTTGFTIAVPKLGSNGTRSCSWIAIGS